MVGLFLSLIGELVNALLTPLRVSPVYRVSEPTTSGLGLLICDVLRLNQLLEILSNTLRHVQAGFDIVH